MLFIPNLLTAMRTSLIPAGAGMYTFVEFDAAIVEA
jgi:hypothetical protein